MTMQSTTTETRRNSRRSTRATPPPAATPMHSSEPVAPGMAPLVFKPDQRQLWLTHGDKPLPFDKAVERVLAERETDGTRTDELADLRGWGFGSADGQTMQIIPTVSFTGQRPEPISLRKMAFGHLCASVGAPAEYISRIPAKLQIVNMNYAMSRASENKPQLLRRAGGDLRAIVSDRYAAFDDDVLLEIVDDVLKASGYRKDAMVRASVVGPHMTLRVTIPSGGVQVKRGDVIEWGLDIGNSELGLRSVQVTPMSYRLVCLNGMRSSDQGVVTRLRHIGDPIKIREDLQVAIPAAFSEARGDLDKWKKSVDTMIDDALGDLESMFGRREASELRAVGRELTGLPETTTNDELSETLRHMRTTVFDVANAMTATARERSDVTSRMQLEETAHRYLTRRTA